NRNGNSELPQAIRLQCRAVAAYVWKRQRTRSRVGRRGYRQQIWATLNEQKLNSSSSIRKNLTEASYGPSKTGGSYYSFTREATPMRLRLTAIAIVLLSSSWALALTSTTVTFQNGDANGYTGTYD